MSRANPRFRRPQNPLPVPTHNIYQAVYSGAFHAQEWQFSLYYQDGGAFPGPNLQASLKGALNPVVTTQIAGCLATDVILNRLVISCLTRPLDAPLVTNLTPVPGTVAGNSRGTIAAMAIGRYTTFRTKCGRGYVNLPVALSSLTTPSDDVVNAAGQALQTNFANACFLSNLVNGADTFTPMVVSRGTRTAPKVLGAAPIATVTIPAVIGTERRRKQDRGG